MELVLFNSEDTDFTLSNPDPIIDWINQTVTTEKKELGPLNFIFCSDPYLHSINVEYLNHDTYTDIITFDYSELPAISGDIFISIDRVKENAETYNTTFSTELKRVIIHGVLHLIGYKDKTDADQEQMTAKEDFYLNLAPDSH